MSPMTIDTVEHVAVLIAGAGRVGLTLALELEHHGVDALLVGRNTTTTRHPKTDITNGRSMGIFRRWGAPSVRRRRAAPADHPMFVTWVTKLNRWELTRFTYPSVEDSDTQTRARNDGTLPLQPSMRVSQILLAPALKERWQTDSKHIQVQYGWQVQSFTQDTDGVDVVLTSPETGQKRRGLAEYLARGGGAGRE